MGDYWEAHRVADVQMILMPWASKPYVRFLSYNEALSWEDDWALVPFPAYEQGLVVRFFFRNMDQSAAELLTLTPRVRHAMWDATLIILAHERANGAW